MATTIQVKASTRRTRTGKTIKIKAHTRIVDTIKGLQSQNRSLKSRRAMVRKEFAQSRKNWPNKYGKPTSYYDPFTKVIKRNENRIKKLKLKIK